MLAVGEGSMCTRPGTLGWATGAAEPSARQAGAHLTRAPPVPHVLKRVAIAAGQWRWVGDDDLMIAVGNVRGSAAATAAAAAAVV